MSKAVPSQKSNLEVIGAIYQMQHGMLEEVFCNHFTSTVNLQCWLKTLLKCSKINYDQIKAIPKLQVIEAISQMKAGTLEELFRNPST